MRLAKVLRQYMWAEKITYRPMARELGMSTATLSRFLNGKELDSENLSRLLIWLLEKEQYDTDGCTPPKEEDTTTVMSKPPKAKTVTPTMGM